jgi:hypothetical protein
MCRLPVFTHLHIQFSLLQYNVLFAPLYTFTYTVFPSPVSSVVCPSLHIYTYSSPFSSIMCCLPFFIHLHIQFSLLQYHVLFAPLYTLAYTVLPSPVSCVVCPSLHICIYSSPLSSIMCRLPVFPHLHIQFSLLQYHVSFARLYTFTLHIQFSRLEYHVSFVRQ